MLTAKQNNLDANLTEVEQGPTQKPTAVDIDTPVLFYTPNSINFDTKFFSGLLKSKKYTTVILDGSKLDMTYQEIKQAVASKNIEGSIFDENFIFLNTKEDVSKVTGSLQEGIYAIGSDFGVDQTQSLLKKADLHIRDSFYPEQTGLESVLGNQCLKNLKEWSAIEKTQTSQTLAIVGGQIDSQKMDILHSMIDKVDSIFIGGQLAYPFLNLMYDVDVGKSNITDQDLVVKINSFLNEANAKKLKIHLPEDFLIGDITDVDTHVFTGDVTNGIPEGLYGLDLGPKSVAKVETLISENSCIVWEGSMGYYLNKKFSNGSDGIINALINKGKTDNKPQTDSCFKKSQQPKIVETSVCKVFTSGNHANQLVLANRKKMNGVQDFQIDSGLEGLQNLLKGHSAKEVIIQIAESQKYLQNLIDQVVLDYCDFLKNEIQSQAKNKLSSSTSSCSSDSSKFEIFVGGLPSDTNHDSLLQYFNTFGDIVSCEPQFWTKGSKKSKCRGYGIVICGNEKTFNKILAKNPHKFEDRRIECKKRLKKQKLAKYSKDLLKRKIFVSGLPSYINSNRLQEFFEEQVGPIEIAYIIKHRKSKKSRGFGFVVFKEKEDRERVISQKEFTLNARTISCNAYEPKETGGNKEQDQNVPSAHKESKVNGKNTNLDINAANFEGKFDEEASKNSNLDQLNHSSISLKKSDYLETTISNPNMLNNTTKELTNYGVNRGNQSPNYNYSQPINGQFYQPNQIFSPQQYQHYQGRPLISHPQVPHNNYGHPQPQQYYSPHYSHGNSYPVHYPPQHHEQFYQNQPNSYNRPPHMDLNNQANNVYPGQGSNSHQGQGFGQNYSTNREMNRNTNSHNREHPPHEQNQGFNEQGYRDHQQYHNHNFNDSGQKDYSSKNRNLGDNSQQDINQVRRYHLF